MLLPRPADNDVFLHGGCWFTVEGEMLLGRWGEEGFGPHALGWKTRMPSYFPLPLDSCILYVPFSLPSPLSTNYLYKGVAASLVKFNFLLLSRHRSMHHLETKMCSFLFYFVMCFVLTSQKSVVSFYLILLLVLFLCWNFSRVTYFLENWTRDCLSRDGENSQKRKPVNNTDFKRHNWVQ